MLHTNDVAVQLHIGVTVNAEDLRGKVGHTTGVLLKVEFMIDTTRNIKLVGVVSGSTWAF